MKEYAIIALNSAPLAELLEAVKKGNLKVEDIRFAPDTVFTALTFKVSENEQQSLESDEKVKRP